MMSWGTRVTVPGAGGSAPGGLRVHPLVALTSVADTPWKQVTKTSGVDRKGPGGGSSHDLHMVSCGVPGSRPARV